MTSISTTHGDLVPALPSQAATHAIWREAVPGLVVLALLLAAVAWGAAAQVRSTPIAGEVETAAMMQVD